MLYTIAVKKVGWRCPGCNRPFKSSQGLGNHARYCKYVKAELAPAEKPTPAPVIQARVSPTAEKSLKGKWDPTWFEAEKRAVLIEETGLRFGVTKYGKVIPMLTGVSYREALVQADKQAFIHSMQPRRPSSQDDTGADDDSLLKLMVLATLVRK